MIRFTCKQCGTNLNRPDDSAGSLVFCTCGQQNRVPWESAEAEPPSTEDPPILLEEEEDSPRSRPVRPSRKVERPPRDPAFCLNHPDRPKTANCADCTEPFCDGCTVTVAGQKLCGPCKNFRVRKLHRPRTPSALAIVSLVVAMISSPFVFCVSFSVVAGQMNSDGPAGVGGIVSAVLSVLPLVSLLLGAIALRQVERNPQMSGRAFAIAGMTTAAAGLLWCLTMAWVAGMRGLGN